MVARYGGAKQNNNMRPGAWRPGGSEFHAAFPAEEASFRLQHNFQLNVEPVNQYVKTGYVANISVQLAGILLPS